jgi:antitoxin component YwqK of YwqJK toxin-antitoxin module
MTNFIELLQEIRGIGTIEYINEMIPNANLADQDVTAENGGIWYGMKNKEEKMKDLLSAAEDISSKISTIVNDMYGSDPTTGSAGTVLRDINDIKEAVETYSSSMNGTYLRFRSLATQLQGAADSMTDNMSAKYDAIAILKTVESFSNEDVNVPIKEYKSNGDGTYTHTVLNPVQYSAKHWKAQAAAFSGSLDDAIMTFKNKTIDDISNDVAANKLSMKVVAGEDLQRGDVVSVSGIDATTGLVTVKKTWTSEQYVMGYVDKPALAGRTLLIVRTGVIGQLDTHEVRDFVELYVDENGNFVALDNYGPVSGNPHETADFGPIEVVYYSKATYGTIHDIDKLRSFGHVLKSDFDNGSMLIDFVYANSKGTSPVYHGLDGRDGRDGVVKFFNQTAQPTDEIEGAFWLNPSNNELKIYSNGAWVTVSGSGGGGGTGSAEHYNQEATPVASNYGATWFQPSSDMLYIWVLDEGNLSKWLPINEVPALNRLHSEQIYVSQENDMFAFEHGSSANLLVFRNGFMLPPVRYQSWNTEYVKLTEPATIGEFVKFYAMPPNGSDGDFKQESFEITADTNTVAYTRHSTGRVIVSRNGFTLPESKYVVNATDITFNETLHDNDVVVCFEFPPNDANNDLTRVDFENLTAGQTEFAAPHKMFDTPLLII